LPQIIGVKKKAAYWQNLLIKRALRENQKIVKIGSLFHKDSTFLMLILKKYSEMQNSVDNIGIAISTLISKKDHGNLKRIYSSLNV